MTFVPKAFCACGCEMLIEKTGAIIEATALIGSYYKVASDLYRCPNCGGGAYLGMPEPFIHHFEAGYADRRVDAQVVFAETLRGSSDRAGTPSLLASLSAAAKRILRDIGVQDSETRRYAHGPSEDTTGPLREAIARAQPILDRAGL